MKVSIIANTSMSHFYLTMIQKIATIMRVMVPMKMISTLTLSMKVRNTISCMNVGLVGKKGMYCFFTLPFFYMWCSTKNLVSRAGCHFGRTIDMWSRFEAIIHQGRVPQVIDVDDE